MQRCQLRQIVYHVNERHPGPFTPAPVHRVDSLSGVLRCPPQEELAHYHDAPDVAPYRKNGKLLAEFGQLLGINPTIYVSALTLPTLS